MPRDYCPRCAAEVPMDEGVCFFGHEVDPDIEPPRPARADAPPSELEELATAVATGEVDPPEPAALGADQGSETPVDPEPARSRAEDLAEDAPDPEALGSPDVAPGGAEMEAPDRIEPEMDDAADLFPPDVDADEFEGGEPTPVETDAEVVEPDVVEPEGAGEAEETAADVLPPSLDPEEFEIIEPGSAEADADVAEPGPPEGDETEIEPVALDEGDVDVDALEAAIAELERREELEEADAGDERDDQSAWDADLTAAAAAAVTEATEGPSTEEPDLGTVWEDAHPDGEEEVDTPDETVATEDDDFAAAAFAEEDGFVADFELPEPDETEPVGTEPEDAFDVAEPPADEDGPDEAEPEPEPRMGSLLEDEDAIDALLAEQDLDTGLTWEVDVPAEEEPDPVADRFEPEEFDVIEPTSDVEGAPEVWEAALDLGTDEPGPPADVADPSDPPDLRDGPEAPELLEEISGAEPATAAHETEPDSEETAAALVDEWDLDWGDEDPTPEPDAEPVSAGSDADAPAPSDTTSETDPVGDADAGASDHDGPAPGPPTGPTDRQQDDEIDPDAFTARRRKKGGLLRRIFG